MRHLRQNRGESAEQWLARLRRIDPAALSRYGRCALTLSIGYARYLTQKESRGQDACTTGAGATLPPPTPHT
jgi:hypothetical protein